MPAASDVATLVRLPAVLTAPGDALLGAATSAARRPAAATLGLVGSSCALYLAGMALNDYADRDVDAVERPHRPIPSGRVTPRFALGLAAGLTALGLGLAAAGGGRRALAVAAPLAATVWAYDLALKGTPAGPAAMAAARTLDVLLGADPARRAAALPAAALVGAHTLKITNVSRHEVQGAGQVVGRRALLGTAAVTAGSALLTGARLVRGGPSSGPRHLAPRPGSGDPRRDTAAARLVRGGLAAWLLGAYATSSALAEDHATRDPSPRSLQQAVGTGVTGLLPLEAGLHAAAGGPLTVSAALAAAWPLARALGRRRAVT